MWFQNQRPILWGCLQIIIKCAWELRSCYREITEFEFSHSGTLSRPSLESHQTPLGSLLSGSQRGLTGPVDYHVHGSPPGNHIKQRSRLSEFGLWFSHGLAGFISWVGGRMKRDGGGRLRGREGLLEPKAPLLHSGLDLRKSSRKWGLKVKSQKTEEEDGQPLAWPSWRCLEKGGVNSTWKKTELSPGFPIN